MSTTTRRDHKYSRNFSKFLALNVWFGAVCTVENFQDGLRASDGDKRRGKADGDGKCLVNRLCFEVSDNKLQELIPPLSVTTFWLVPVYWAHLWLERSVDISFDTGESYRMM